MSSICIVTALPAESRVFIDALKLTPILDQGWRLYGNSERLLLQTGMGKLKASAAISAVLHTYPEISTLINVGIAGGDAPLGSAFIGSCIIDSGSGASWYPHLPPQRILDSLATTYIETLDTPSSDYKAGVLYDMEAAGIVSAATPYLSTDAIHFLKVVSDNPDASFNELGKSDVVGFMQGVEPLVQQLISWCDKNSKHHDVQLSIHTLQKRVMNNTHHTANDKHQLLRLIQQHYALTGALPKDETLLQLNSSKKIRDYLQKTIDDIEFTYGDAV